jgi:GT2 family glycosyltransferase
VGEANAALSRDKPVQEPLVGILVLNWNSPQDTIRCLRSIENSDYQNFIILVVDNGSKDDSLDQLHIAYPDLEILETGHNLGYCGGNNAGIRYLLDQGAEYIWLLNDDIAISPVALSHLLRAAIEHPDAGFLGPKIVSLNDSKRLLSTGGLLTQDYQPIHRGMGESDNDQYNQHETVDFLSGCALLVSKNTIQGIGLLDEAYFTYYEDIDWCFRGREAGLDCLFVPDSVARHPDTRQRDSGAPLVTHYLARNRLFFIHKHRLGARISFNTLLEDGRTVLSWSLRPRWKHKKRQRHALVTGILDFFRGRQGKIQHL